MMSRVTHDCLLIGPKASSEVPQQERPSSLVSMKIQDSSPGFLAVEMRNGTGRAGWTARIAYPDIGDLDGARFVV
jgi:hypothetical protein